MGSVWTDVAHAIIHIRCHIPFMMKGSCAEKPCYESSMVARPKRSAAETRGCCSYNIRKGLSGSEFDKQQTNLRSILVLAARRLKDKETSRPARYV